MKAMCFNLILNLRKLLFMSVLLFVGINMLAQISPFRFGAKAGLNLSTAFVNDASAMKFKSGYSVGGTIEYLLTESFIIQSGLFLSTKGSVIEDLNSGSYVGGTPDFTHTFNELYLELPLFCAFKKNISNNLNVVFGFGPYFGYGIGGKTKKKLNSSIWGDGTTEISWHTFGDGVYDESRSWLRGESLNRLDFGVGINADVEYNKFVWGIGFRSGIIDIIKKEPYFQNLHYLNFNLSISMGYKF